MTETTPLVCTAIQLDASSSNDHQHPHTDSSAFTSTDGFGFISLFRILTNFKRSQDDLWGLVGLPSSESWNRFLMMSQAVETFRVHLVPSPFQTTIKPATFVRVARMLEGRPLFPSLRHLQIESLSHSIDNYLALLASPALERITLTYRPPALCNERDDRYQELAMPFFTELAFYSTKLQVLLAEKVVPAIPITWLQTISNFRELRVLKLECLLRVPEGEFDPYIQCLESLRSLEILWLRLEEIVPVIGELPHQTSELHEGVESTTLLPESPPVTQLDIVGPAHLVSKIVSTFGSRALKTISISLPPPLEPSTGPPPDAIHSLPTLDLRPLKQVLELQSLHLLECSLKPSTELIEPGVWPRLVSLALPSSMVVDLLQLKSIAESLPSLRTLLLWLGDFENLSPPGGITVPTELPLHHPLESLEILPPSLFFPGRKKFVHIYPCIPVARYLNALFPRLQSLAAGRDVAKWSVIFELMKLCQASLMDDKNRRTLFSEV